MYLLFYPWVLVKASVKLACKWHKLHVASRSSLKVHSIAGKLDDPVLLNLAVRMHT